MRKVFFQILEENVRQNRDIFLLTGDLGVKFFYNFRNIDQKRFINVGVAEPNMLPLVDKKVKEYDIKVAIHNHGPTDKIYPTPETAYEKIKDLDKRIGLCDDIGHTIRAGVDSATSLERFADRLIDIHMKDVTAADPKGGAIEVGRGVINIPQVIRTLVKINFTGIVSFEYEKSENDPLPGLAESVGYVRGVMATV